MWLVIILILIIIGLLALALWLWSRIRALSREYTILGNTMQAMLSSEPQPIESLQSEVAPTIVGARGRVLVDTEYGKIVRGSLPPVDQGDCNACWAISTCQAVTDRLHLKGKIPGDQLNYYSYHDIITSRTDEQDGCAYGTNLETGLERFITDGAPLMSQSKDRTFNDRYIRDDTVAKPITIRGWRQLTVEDRYGNINIPATIDAIKRELEQRGTIVGVINLYESFNYFVGDSVYIPGIAETTDESMAHMISIVGYDDRDRTWIIRNSYGPSFGYHGYMKIHQGDKRLNTEEYVYAPDV